MQRTSASGIDPPNPAPGPGGKARLTSVFPDLDCRGRPAHALRWDPGVDPIPVLASKAIASMTNEYQSFRRRIVEARDGRIAAADADAPAREGDVKGDG